MDTKGKILRSDYIIALTIILLPFLFYSYLLFPELNQINFGKFSVSLPSDWDFQYTAWIFLWKLLILVLYSVWFVTCVHWWRYAILVTIYMIVRQLFSFIAIDLVHKSFFSECKALLLFGLYTILLLYISKKLHYYTTFRALGKELFHEIEKLVINKHLYTQTSFESNIAKLHDIKNKREQLKQKEYLHTLYFLKLKNSDKAEESHLFQEENSKKKIVFDILFIALVLSLPLVYRLFSLAPEKETWETSFFTINSHLFEDVNYLLWIFCNKFIVVYGCLIWYISTKHWWRNVLLLPIALVTIQIFVLLDNDIEQFDEVDFLYVIPLAIALMFFIYWLGNKINYYSKTQEFLMELDNEIEESLIELEEKKRSFSKELTEKLSSLRSQKNRFSEKDYLLRLIKLRNQITE